MMKRQHTAAGRDFHLFSNWWLAAVSTWSQLRVAAGCRFHNEATLMLRQGRVGPDATPLPEILAAIATSKTEPAALPWPNAPPICRATINLVYHSTREWHHDTHWLHHTNVRVTVTTVLLVATRLGTRMQPFFLKRTNNHHYHVGRFVVLLLLLLWQMHRYRSSHQRSGCS